MHSDQDMITITIDSGDGLEVLKIKANRQTVVDVLLENLYPKNADFSAIAYEKVDSKSPSTDLERFHFKRSAMFGTCQVLRFRASFCMVSFCS